MYSDVEFREGIYIGYRYYETKADDMNAAEAGSGDAWYQEAVLYPFGYGLSYTTFEYRDAKAKDLGNAISVSCKIKNTGARAGEEIMLVFVGSDIAGKPHKLLKGFSRVALEAHEETECAVTIAKETLRLYDRESGAMVIPENLTVYVGRNAEDAENIVLNVD